MHVIKSIFILLTLKLALVCACDETKFRHACGQNHSGGVAKARLHATDDRRDQNGGSSGSGSLLHNTTQVAAQAFRNGEPNKYSTSVVFPPHVGSSGPFLSSYEIFEFRGLKNRLVVQNLQSTTLGFSGASTLLLHVYGKQHTIQIPKAKKRELFHPCSRFLLASRAHEQDDESEAPVAGFLMWRFDFEECFSSHRRSVESKTFQSLQGNGNSTINNSGLKMFGGMINDDFRVIPHQILEGFRVQNQARGAAIDCFCSLNQLIKKKVQRRQGDSPSSKGEYNACPNAFTLLSLRRLGRLYNPSILGPVRVRVRLGTQIEPSQMY
ncbi:uncharacterized protein PGTG_14999 [Puccinia graminis f. sp. tritici CRL 75-36-700-3]|uniref:Uncharacterized protein n=1 Tax=Puccinia graminis f. sp. tritici (strain CRL 75-36-700-3 / race SCCL) TaxID=418459 RepID=E3KY78_PUCGT|nr:uncharacterized protein PGTG_14999 [Puccinia graminis f. sp. tritici CRL 75-36-700-3]EFP89158.2 hypothetical protein PGTG_14999 [Puccinia graminis f. sp. tritici CRL 75-36-700-3]